MAVGFDNPKAPRPLEEFMAAGVGLGNRVERSDGHYKVFAACDQGINRIRIWDFPKIAVTLFGGPYNKGPTI